MAIHAVCLRSLLRAELRPPSTLQLCLRRVVTSSHMSSEPHPPKRVPASGSSREYLELQPISLAMFHWLFENAQM